MTKSIQEMSCIPEEETNKKKNKKTIRTITIIKYMHKETFIKLKLKKKRIQWWWHMIGSINEIWFVSFLDLYFSLILTLKNKIIPI